MRSYSSNNEEKTEITLYSILEHLITEYEDEDADDAEDAGDADNAEAAAN